MKEYNAFSQPLIDLLVEEKATFAKAKGVHFENCHAELNLSCDSASIYANTSTYMCSFITFTGQHRHASVSTRILIV